MDRGAWRATVHGVTKSQTRLSKLITHTLLWGLHMGGIIQDLSFGNGFISLSITLSRSIMSWRVSEFPSFIRLNHIPPYA